VLQDADRCVIVDEVQDLRDLSLATAIWRSSAIRTSVTGHARRGARARGTPSWSVLHGCVRYAGRAGVLMACGDRGDSGAAVQAHAAIAP
jgi:hypothetical protein